MVLYTHIKNIPTKLVAILNGLSHFNGTLMPNRCILFNGMCVQYCVTVIKCTCSKECESGGR